MGWYKISGNSERSSGRFVALPSAALNIKVITDQTKQASDPSKFIASKLYPRF